MIHLFKQNNYNVCLDVNSGSIHVPDDMTFDILMQNPSLEDYNKFKKNHKSDNSNIAEILQEIDKLIEEGILYSTISIPDIDKTKDVVLKALCLHMAHTCNLRCKYCFAGDGEYCGGKKLMPFEVAKKAVDLLLKKSGTKKNVEIDFFGGEPMLNFDVVKQTVEYARSVEEKYNKEVNFTITTNATIMDDDAVEFINENMDNVVLSIDGRKEIHDRHRIYPDGSGSYDKVIPNVKKVVAGRNGKSYFVRGTYTEANLDFSNDVKHLASYGFKDISIEPAIGGEYGIKQEHVHCALEEYEKLASEYAKQDEYTYYHFKLDLYHGPCIYKRVTACGAGFEYGAVTPDGEIFACHRLAGEEQFKMGSVFDAGFNTELAEKMKKNNVMNIEKCKKCWAKFFCSGGCPATAYFSNGSIDEPDEISCILQKKRIECALAVEVQRNMEGFYNEE